MPTAPTTTLRDHLATIRRHRWVLVLCIAIFGGAAIAYSASQDPKYRSEASLSFREPTQDAELIGVAAFRSSTPEERAAVGAEQANEREVLEAARRRLRLRDSVSSLDDKVEARAEVRTNLVVVQAEDEDPRRAAALANAVADETVRAARRVQRARYNDLIRTTTRQYRRSLRGNDPIRIAQRRDFEQRLVQLRATRDFTSPAQVTEAASIPEDPFAPKPARNAAIGLGAGLLIGIGMAFLLGALDRRLRSVRDITDEADLPLLGAVRNEALGQVNAAGPDGSPDDVDLEAFRIVRTNLEYLNVDDPPRRILVTSAMPEEGKSTVASSLAAAIALSDRRVLVVECDLRRPVFAERFGIAGEPGLTDYLAGRAEPGDVVRAVNVGAAATNGSGPGPASGGSVLAVLPAGAASNRPAELLGSERFKTLLDEVSSVYDVVILDSPPLLAVGDALELVERADAVLLCVRANRTTRDQLRSASMALSRLPDRPSGVVVTGTSPGDGDEYGYYSYAYSAYATRR